MPRGSLKEYMWEGPAPGLPAREKSTRSIGRISVIVPTVERALPPTCRWSMTIAVVRFSITSASGRSYLGIRLRTKAGRVSFSCRWDSTARVSNTTEDFPDPETPVKTVSFLFGMRRSTPLRLFCRASPSTMKSSGSVFR